VKRGKHMIARCFALAALAVLLPGLGSAQDSYRHGRVLHVEGTVTIQRVAEAVAEEAVPNLPFLPGDRVWTDRESRGEFQFADGTLLRIDRRTKIEYAAHEERRGEDRIALALWSGSVIVRRQEGRDQANLSIEAPGGLYVDLVEGGVYRVGLEAGETRIAVYQGEALVEGDRRLRVRAGEQVFARGVEVGRTGALDRRDLDDFARWDEDRQGGQAWARERSEYLPDEVSVYGPELEQHGAWYYEVEVGHVWRPYVSGSWRPYSDGRWVWTAYGWTWVPNESWGWAVSHYGRWGWSARLGWYWIPSGGWGPAWVSWAMSDDYVGWSALGHRDRPVVIHERRGDRAVPRGSFSGGTWTVARRGDMGARDLARRRMDAGPNLIGRLRPLEGARRLSRELAVTERPLAAPRTVRTRPRPGDTIPELRSDPATTIPAPTARTRYESEREAQEQERSQILRRGRPRESQRDGDSGAIHEATPRTSGAADRTRGRVEERKRDDQQGTSREQGRARSEDSDRKRPGDLLGPLFRPLSRLRGNRDEGESARESGGESSRSRDSGRTNRTRPEAAPREAAPPRRVEPRTPPPTQPPSSSNQSGGRAVRRDRKPEE